jgi:hypothetical protein
MMDGGRENYEIRGRREWEKYGISRRQTQTFSSADLAEENRLALRATEKNYATGFTGLCRISFSSGKR